MGAGAGTLGQSPTAAAFGATVELGAGRGGLCLVVGRDASPTASVASVQGRLVTRLPGDRRVLAMLSWEALQTLQHDPAVALAGPVSIDPQRFARFAALAGLDAGDAPSPTAPSGAQEV
jgi:hypothetical protein